MWIDGYNLLITVESALGGAVVLAGRDRCLRDLASLHGTYRRVEETLPALAAIGAWLVRVRAGSCRWLLDQPVANSGRLRGLIRRVAATEGWPWDVELAPAPDAALRETDAIVVTSDSVVLDHCAHWTNLARELVTAACPDAWIVPLGSDTDERVDAPIRT